MGGEPPAATFLLREPRFSPAAAAGAKGRAARDRSLITPLPPPAPDPRAGGHIRGFGREYWRRDCACAPPWLFTQRRRTDSGGRKSSAVAARAPLDVRASAMWGLVRSRRCWIFSVMLSACALLRADGYPAGTERPAGIRAPVQSPHKAAAGGSRLSRSATEEPYWAYSGIYGPDEGWVSAFPECREKNQSPINIVDKDAKVSTEYQELILEGFDTKSSNKTTMKNTGKTVAITLKDEYFVQGGGLPGRFKAEKLEFHWGPVNGSDGSEHSVDGRRFPVEMQIFMYNSDDFDSLGAALRQRRMIAAMAVFFQVGGRDYHAADAIIHGLKGVVHHEKETFLEPFVLKDLLPPSLGSYYRYSGSLTTPPCSKVVEWIIFSRPIYISYKQLEAFYSIFTTEQQDHVKSVEYLRSNFRPVQSLDNRIVFKSAV
ncbi:Receptor-type tyrosine-protein phosphatase gamma, partial [Oryzias melastigma]